MNKFDTFDVEGVSIDIKLSNGQKIFIEEAENKSWKKKGQISTVMGTCDKYNENLRETATRELKEEIGLSVDQEQLKENGFFYMYVDGKKIKIHRFTLEINISSLGELKTNVSDEISKILLLDEGDFEKIYMKDIRPGTIETLLKSNNIFSYIVHIDNGVYHQNTLELILKDKNNIGF